MVDLAYASVLILVNSKFDLMTSRPEDFTWLGICYSPEWCILNQHIFHMYVYICIYTYVCVSLYLYSMDICTYIYIYMYVHLYKDTNFASSVSTV